MIQADEFISATTGRGFSYYCGVPCSYLTPLINRVISRPDVEYHGAANEGDAVAMAAGAWIGGRQSVVMMQNSGLGNAINPLTSLNWPFRIPALLIITWRGMPGGKLDEPQHELMGRQTQRILEAINIAYMPFPKRMCDVATALDCASDHMASSYQPFALLMEQGSVETAELAVSPTVPSRVGRITRLWQDGLHPTRIDCLTVIRRVIPDHAVILATTGMTGRELYSLGDRDNQLYQVGSMGCVSSMGLGLSSSFPGLVTILDGDGSVLMRMGALAVIGSEMPENFLHIVLDNGVHDSTGGQATVSPYIDIAGIARSCGYRECVTTDNLDGLEAGLGIVLAGSGPNLLHVRIAPGCMDAPPRPSISPERVARRLRDFVTHR